MTHSVRHEKRMLPQEQMIESVRHLCDSDNAIVAAAMYGSFARGEGDEFSDIEFYLFVDDSAYDTFDLGTWIQRIAPVDDCFPNEFGTTVALFSSLIRGEFHASPASSMSQVRTWASNVWVQDVDSMVVLDRTGELRGHLSALVGSGPDRSDPNEVSLLFQRFLDWIVFGTSVLRRGEHARALELLWFIHRHLLWMVRILEGATANYPTPSKALETDISSEAYERYKTCAAVLSRESLEDAYSASWSWGKELMAALSQSSGVPQPETVMTRLDERFAEWFAERKTPNNLDEGDADKRFQF